jgi:acyl carrier protein
MLPSATVILPRLPLSPSGKLDRKALPEPTLAAYAIQEYEGPQSEVEMVLARIWQELLKVERVGRHDDFFELGGHSLHGIQLATRIEAAFAVRLSVVAVFKYPSVRAMAELVQSLRWLDQPVAAVCTQDDAQPDSGFEEGVVGEEPAAANRRSREASQTARGRHS